MNADLFTITTLAKRWGVNPVTVRKMVRRGDIKTFSVGNQTRITIENVKRHEGWNQESNSENIAGDM